jgi:hypothetical protein
MKNNMTQSSRLFLFIIFITGLHFSCKKKEEKNTDPEFIASQSRTIPCQLSIVDFTGNSTAVVNPKYQIIDNAGTASMAQNVSVWDATTFASIADVSDADACSLF